MKEQTRKMEMVEIWFVKLDRGYRVLNHKHNENFRQLGIT